MRGIAIEKRYRDERKQSEEEGQRRANYLWANTSIMFPAIYGKCPQPIIKRTFNNKDPIGRAASSILECALHDDLETDNFHESVGSAVLDFLLPGRAFVGCAMSLKSAKALTSRVDGSRLL
jgi:hypothetical protein